MDETRRLQLQLLDSRTAFLINNSTCVIFPSGEPPQERPHSTVGIERVSDIFVFLKDEGMQERRKKMQDFSQVQTPAHSKQNSMNPFDVSRDINRIIIFFRKIMLGRD